MWNPFKKSSKSCDVKREQRHLVPVNDNLTPQHVTCRDDVGDCQQMTTSLEGELCSSDGGVPTPSKGKVKRKLSLFGNKSRAKTTTSGNTGSGSCDVSVARNDEPKPNGSCSTSEAVLRNTDAGCVHRDDHNRCDKQNGVVEIKTLAEEKRQSGSASVGSGSVSSASCTGGDCTSAMMSRSGRGTGCGILDVSDMTVDDDDEVFHRQLTTLSTFAATASVDVIAKPSPPKMKRRAKLSSGNETETRRSKLSKPTSPVVRPVVEPVHVLPVVVPTKTSGEGDNKNALFRSPISGNPSTVAGGSKRIPPPVPIRRSSTRNGCSELLSPSRDFTTSGARKLPPCSSAASGQRLLESVSSMKSSPGDSGSDDTEGKESGYVTLDDIQAQLMRSSWSSDDREVEQTITSGNTVTDNLLQAATGGK